MTAAWLIVSAVPVVNGGSVQLISARDPSVQLPAGGNDNSADAVISPDGRFVVFSSAAADLLPGHNRQLNLDVYLYDRIANTLTLVSSNLAGTGSGNSYSIFGQVSTNGCYVLFESGASDLTTNDPDFYTDIFVRDLIKGTTSLVSAPTNGNIVLTVSGYTEPGKSSSSDSVMTPDGCYAAFVSSSSSLVGGDTNGIADVFVRDLAKHITFRVSAGAVRNLPAPPPVFPAMAAPAITPDGQHVAFFSTAAGLAGPNPPAGGEVYVHDLIAGTTILASSNAAAIASAAFGTLNNYASYHAEISDDGQFVAFKAVASSAIAPVFTNAVVFQCDLSSGTTTIIDTNALGEGPVDQDRFGPEMTPDGRFIAYVHREPDSGNGVFSSVHVWDSRTATDVLVSDDGSGVPPGTASDTPVISPDGQFVTFLSNATNLVANPVSSGFHIYLRDLQTGTMQLVDVDTNGVGSTDMAGVVPGMSADGRFIVFNAPDGSLVNFDNNRSQDVFLRDTVAGTTTIISRRDSALVSTTGNGITRFVPFSMSADGRWMAFESAATVLVPNDTNNVPDVFVRDLQSGQTTLVSVGVDGSSASGGLSGNGLLSADGRFVVFLSSATNLVAGQVCSNLNVFRRDLLADTTVLVSRTNGINAVSGNCFNPVMSSNGQFVAYWNTGDATVNGGIYWEDIDSGTNQLPGPAEYIRIPGTGPWLSISVDGRYVSYDNPGLIGVRVRDTRSGTDVYTNTASIASALLSPDGSRLLYVKTSAPAGVYVDNVVARTNVFYFPGAATIQNSSQWTADSRFIVFLATTNLIAGDTNPGNKVYLCDLQTGSFTLVSVNCGHTASSTGISDMPVISSDGRFVIYRSTALDLVPFDLNPVPKVFVYDSATAVNTILSPAQNDANPFPWISGPIVNAGGQQLGFQSVGASLVPGDLNRVPDGFATGLDSDGDGIPDWWMQQYFGHPTGQAGDLSLAQDDADGDGVSNLQEYLNGTNPRSATSDFTVEIFPVVSPANSVTLMWPASVAANFTVQYKNNLNDAQWQDSPGNASIVANRAYFTVPADQPGRFYRVLGSN